MENLVTRFIPFQRIDDNLRAGRVHGISVSTTHVRTGRTVVWAQRAEAGLPPWHGDPTVIPRATQLRARHALASAAIPFLFPAVRIDGDWFCDGGLRQNVPLSPARRLGADGLVIVNPRWLPPPEQVKFETNDSAPGPLALLGKMMNALLLDRLDNDIDRLRGINEIVEAGCTLYGPGFLDALNRQLGRAPGRGLRQVKVVLIRTSQDLGRLAAAFIKTTGFAARSSGMIGAVLRRLAEGDDSRQADFISYLLFDGEFARQLIELGRADARAKHDELCAFFREMTG
jgi:NTE family protein